jgi:hypothetical protein
MDLTIHGFDFLTDMTWNYIYFTLKIDLSRKASLHIFYVGFLRILVWKSAVWKMRLQYLTMNTTVIYNEQTHIYVSLWS